MPSASRRGARPGRAAATDDEIDAAAAPLGGGDLRPAGSFWLAVQPTKVIVLDRFGDPAAEIMGVVADQPDDVAALVDKLTKYRGPVTLKPSVWVIDGSHLMELSSGDVVASAEAVVDASTRPDVHRGTELSRGPLHPHRSTSPQRRDRHGDRAVRRHRARMADRQAERAVRCQGR